MDSRHQIVRAFFAALSQGAFPQGMLTPEMGFWSLTGGDGDRQRFEFGIKVLQSLFPAGLHYVVERVVAEGEAAFAEVRSSGEFEDGEHFQNVHVFVFGFAGDAIASLKEYQHLDPVRTQLGPRMQAAMAKQS